MGLPFLYLLSSSLPLTFFLGINLHHFVFTPQAAEKDAKKGVAAGVGGIAKKFKKTKDKKKASLSVAVWDFAGQEVYVCLLLVIFRFILLLLLFFFFF